MGTAALVQRARAGDKDAFAQMYGDFADGIYDFCCSLLRDPEEAADAMHDTFVLAAQHIRQLRDPDRLKAWLFAIARHVALRRVDQRRRVTPVDVPPEVVLDDDPIRGISASEASALVWAAAAGLNPRDQAVLTLNARHGFEGAELAAAIGLHHANPYSLLHRAKAQLERAVGVLLIARSGRGACAPLSELLGDWDGTLTPLLRKRINRHVDECATCQRTRSGATPRALLGTLPVFAARRADALSVDEVLATAHRRPASTERWRRDGFPPGRERARRRRPVVLVIAAGLGIAIVLSVATLAGGDGGTGTTRVDPGPPPPPRPPRAPPPPPPPPPPPRPPTPNPPPPPRPTNRRPPTPTPPTPRSPFTGTLSRVRPLFRRCGRWCRRRPGWWQPRRRPRTGRRR
ncbi:MAG: RNA polymerase sigma factor [Actinomycetota bacterium]